ncbi:MAG: helix-turn-helix transcriptional regulator [Bacillota bacterium]
MEHVQATRIALDYIERNLREEIRVDDLARAVHFSSSHFPVIFAKVVGCTVAEYIRRRRLAYAAWDLALSSKRILDIALEYRFESQEVFTRAFKRRYGITPGFFRRNDHFVATMARMGPNRSYELIRKGVTMVAESQDVLMCSESRLVLDGVMRVGFYHGGDQCPEDIPFPSCLAAVLRYLGEDYRWEKIHSHNMEWRLNMANVHLLGVTGMVFGLLWKDGWHPDNADMMFIADPREVIERAFRSVGYEYEIVKKRGQPDDEQFFREKIKQSIQAGHPVLGFGIIGPPECSVITGYDNHGETLIGWNFFQDVPEFNQGITFEPTGCFRKGDWFKDTMSLIVIGSKLPTADCIDDREMIRWALHVARTPEVLGRNSGIAAYDAWMRQIGNDADFATDDRDLLFQRHDVHNSAVGIVAECRSWAHSFVLDMATREPRMAEDLRAAGECYQQEHDLMWKVWGLVGGNGQPEAFLKFADPQIRRQIIAVVAQARDLDIRAAEYLERALDS